jgi:hypothetical protein
MARTTNKRLRYLKDTNEILNNDPAVIVELIPLQFQTLVSSDLVDSLPVCEHKVHHIVGRVPLGYNIAGDEPLLEVKFGARAAPCREGDCC